MRIRRRTLNIVIVTVVMVLVISSPVLVGVILGTGGVYHAILLIGLGIVAVVPVCAVVLYRGPVHWYVTRHERDAVERSLRASGYTSGWVLDTDDRRNLVFVVADDEPGARPAEGRDETPPSLQEAESALREALPSRSVSVRLNSAGRSRARLF
jgi:hypothetical protein